LLKLNYSKYLCNNFTANLTNTFKIMANLNFIDADEAATLFNFPALRKTLDLIPRIEDRLKYLYCVKTDFLQYINIDHIDFPLEFDYLCDLEIDKLIKIKELDLQSLSHTKFDFPDKVDVSYIKNYIIHKFNECHLLKWKYFFLSENDFIDFVNSLTNFFSGKEIKSNQFFSFKARCKTNLCLVLSSIYRNFKKTPLKTDTDFLTLLQNTSIFINRSQFEIYSNLLKGRLL